MKKKAVVSCAVTAALLVSFLVWVVLLLTVDVQAVGPNDSKIGLATLNRAVFDAIGTDTMWEKMTDILSYAALAVAAGFAVFGVVQLIRRQNLRKIDPDLLVLALSYVLVAVFYLLFEFAVVNYRPILDDGALAASFPSSTVMIVVAIMGTTALQCNARLKHSTELRAISISLAAVVTVATVVGRLLSGVHWLTDIVGGVLLGAFVVMLYVSLTKFIAYRQEKKTQGDL